MVCMARGFRPDAAVLSWTEDSTTMAARSLPLNQIKIDNRRYIMKSILLAIAASVSGIGFAQTSPLANEKSVELSEVSIKADRIIKTADGFKLFPTVEQISSSTNGYDLIKHLSLPQIRVDEVMRTIKANDMIGSVQIRINNIIATEQIGRASCRERVSAPV